MTCKVQISLRGNRTGDLVVLTPEAGAYLLHAEKELRLSPEHPCGEVFLPTNGALHATIVRHGAPGDSEWDCEGARAQAAYAAYRDAVGGKAWDGTVIPELLTSLPEDRQKAWRAAAAAI